MNPKCGCAVSFATPRLCMEASYRAIRIKEAGNPGAQRFLFVCQQVEEPWVGMITVGIDAWVLLTDVLLRSLALGITPCVDGLVRSQLVQALLPFAHSLVVPY